MSAPHRRRRPRKAVPRPVGFRDRLYETIFESDTRGGKLFDLFLLTAIFASIVAVSLESVPSISAQHHDKLIVLEWGFTLLFSIEYLLRLYCVTNRRAYATSFWGLIDLASILPSYVGLISGGVISFPILRSFRLLRVFRVLNLFHLSEDATEMGQAIWQARGKVIVFLSFVAIVVTVSGATMYEIERFGHRESKFDSIPQSIYWAIVTMTTVGYGDIVPQTPLGKFVSAVLILIGYSLIIVPTGFVSAELLAVRRHDHALTQTCPHCLLEGHERDAVFCRVCGHQLEPDGESVG